MSKQPATPVPAATLMLIRDSADGLEVFMVERHHQIDFATGALVFPGGKIDKADFDPGLRARCENAAHYSELELALRVGGIREAFEECGVLLAHDAGGSGLVNAGRLRDLEHYRKELVDCQITMLEFLTKENLILLPQNLVPFAHWITPPMVPKRFDTHFFIIEAPMDHIALHDGHESVDSVWIKPSKVIEEGDAGRRTVIFPTRMNVQKLGRCTTVAEALETARASKIVTVLPQMMQGDDGPYLKIPEEAGYDISIQPLAGMRGA
ncbi:MAG TPA: NUDIX hydrolase [Alphaproteobacteria bacterium]|jgi:8-oxo-dGTP pyrophosphatase MutT (NUDIX family)|nr:NUDIX hydrolase [Alphaproteobacteria bacterium]